MWCNVIICKKKENVGDKFLKVTKQNSEHNKQLIYQKLQPITLKHYSNFQENNEYLVNVCYFHNFNDQLLENKISNTSK